MAASERRDRRYCSRSLSRDDREAIAAALAEDEGNGRTGVFTSGIVSLAGEHQIALFFTGRQHAGENLADVLANRATERAPPIQMCDGLSRNTADEFESILASCMVHARRRFVDVVEDFPDEVRYILEVIKEVYQNDAEAREQGLSADERLRLHQRRSGPLMGRLKRWLREQIISRKVEPNSGLGDAIRYMQKHWRTLILFLREPGRPVGQQQLLQELLEDRTALRRRRRLKAACRRSSPALGSDTPASDEGRPA